MNRKIEEIMHKGLYPQNEGHSLYIEGVPEVASAISNLLDQEMGKFAEWIGKEMNVTINTSELLTLYKAEMNTKECG